MTRRFFIALCVVTATGCFAGVGGSTDADAISTPGDSAVTHGGEGDAAAGDSAAADGGGGDTTFGGDTAAGDGAAGDAGGGDTAAGDGAATDGGGGGDTALGDDTAAGDGGVLLGDTTTGDSTPCTTCWRSSLYPSDWTPSTTDGSGRFLHDFSYAGYHNGEAALPDTLVGTAFDVTGYGADPTGQTDACPAIQGAIDDAAAAGGGIVLLPAGTYRCDGRLTVTGDGVVLRGAGAATQLFFTQGVGMSGAAHLTLRGNIQRGADLPLATDAQDRARVIELVDASSLAVGDAIAVGWVITAAFTAAHGMTGIWTAFTGQWKPIFRREVRAVDLTSTPHRVTVDVPLRYDALVRDQASVRVETGYLSEVGIDAIAVSNAVSKNDAWAETRVHVIEINGVRDGFVRNVVSFHSSFGADNFHLMSGGIAVFASKRVTVTDSRMEKAQHRGGGGNGYLFEVSRSNEILFKDSVGIDGRHNFIQNWDFGTSGCVFLRCESAGGRMLSSATDTVGLPGFCEFHHSLAMGNLIDQCTLTDGWFGGNRLTESSGAGHTTTENVYWNTQGTGIITSMAYGNGYVIGPNSVLVVTTMLLPQALGTAPRDFVERGPAGDRLEPSSLYEDQLARRLP